MNALATTAATTEGTWMTGAGDDQQTVTMTTPWWYGVKGLDPGNPTDDIQQAARLTAIACAVHVMNTQLIHGERVSWAMKRNRALPEVRSWYDWLTASGDHLEAYARRVTLRLVCDLPIDDYTLVLPTAMALCEAAPAPAPEAGPS
jgi:hypothetical protein